MNGKLARALRKEAGYAPSDQRKYESMQEFSFMGRVKTIKGTIINATKTSRARYLKLKREIKNYDCTKKN